MAERIIDLNEWTEVQFDTPFGLYTGYEKGDECLSGHDGSWHYSNAREQGVGRTKEEAYENRKPYELWEL